MTVFEKYLSIYKILNTIIEVVIIYPHFYKQVIKIQEVVVTWQQLEYTAGFQAQVLCQAGPNHHKKSLNPSVRICDPFNRSHLSVPPVLIAPSFTQWQRYNGSKEYYSNSK
jgi:hypothetical protein